MEHIYVISFVSIFPVHTCTCSAKKFTVEMLKMFWLVFHDLYSWFNTSRENIVSSPCRPGQAHSHSQLFNVAGYPEYTIGLKIALLSVLALYRQSVYPYRRVQSDCKAWLALSTKRSLSVLNAWELNIGHKP